MSESCFGKFALKICHEIEVICQLNLGYLKTRTLIIHIHGGLLVPGILVLAIAGSVHFPSLWASPPDWLSKHGTTVEIPCYESVLKNPFRDICCVCIDCTILLRFRCRPLLRLAPMVFNLFSSNLKKICELLMMISVRKCGGTKANVIGKSSSKKI